MRTAAQRDDDGSMLSLYRAALALRGSLTGHDVEWLQAPDGCIAFGRAGGLVCFLNLSGAPVALPAGEVLLSSLPVDGGALPDDAAVWLQP